MGAAEAVWVVFVLALSDTLPELFFDFSGAKVEAGKGGHHPLLFQFTRCVFALSRRTCLNLVHFLFGPLRHQTGFQCRQASSVY